MSVNDSKEWWVYIVQCRDGSYYTGSTPNIEQRIATHNSGKGAKYTRARLPVKIVFTEKKENHSQALKREFQIKSLKRDQKKILVNQFFQQLEVK